MIVGQMPPESGDPKIRVCYVRRIKFSQEQTPQNNHSSKPGFTGIYLEESTMFKGILGIVAVSALLS
ncbi:MAG: hypothetical protein ABI561_25620, partial [Bradyrhizobium sp.]